jgi:hypothetical protein
METRVLLSRPATHLAAAGIGLAFAMAARDARADVNACLDASEQGQVLRDRWKLIDARAKFVACARAECPSMVRSDCAKWLADVDERMPAVLVRARTAGGADLADVRTFVDDVPLADAASGHFVPIDPGPHAFRFERPGSAPVTQRVVIRERERDRILDVLFHDAGVSAAPPPVPAPLPAPPPASASASAPRATRPVPPLVFALAGVAAVGGGAFAYFASAAKHDVDQMRATCAPACSDGDVSHARTELIVANASLGVAVVSLAAATWLFLARPEVRVGASVEKNGAAVFVGRAF